MCLQAGFPGVLSDRLGAAHGGKSVCVFLNGACGNVIHRNYSDPACEDTKERIGSVLADKEQSQAKETFVVSLANGWLGYIPHREAFDRIGGHESTWCISSKMEPEAGDRMADAMLEIIRQVNHPGAG